jgi:hypothetical protein
VTTARVVAAALLAALILPATAGAFAGRNGAIAIDGRAGAKNLLSLRNANGSGLRTIATSERPTRPAFSAAGVRIAYAAGGRIWVAQAGGTAQRQLTAGYKDGDPTWSPLGDAIAFTTGPSGGRDIYSIGTDGNNLRRLTSKPADEISPAWSARADIAFVRITEGGDGDLWRINAGGGTRHLTKGPADDREPAWSPDGRRIAFTRNTPRHRDVYIANSLGHHIRKLRSLPRAASTPVFSPDGRWLAFAMGKGSRRGVWVMRTNGKRLRRIFNGSVGARAIDWQATPGDPVIAGAGDIACDPSTPFWNDGYGTAGACHERYTSDELLKMDLDSVFMLGDAQYEDATPEKFALSYDPSWGRLKAMTHPVIGNHEYYEPTATGYWDYFNGPGQANGPAGTRGEGWYSFDIGAWHVVALNSNCDRVSCAAGSPQEQWLRADLAAHPTACTLAVLHHPLVSSGESDEGEGTTPAVAPLWQALYDANADLVYSGHDHAYERFAPLNPQAQYDPARGMRMLLTGTGGKNLQAPVAIRPGSEARQGESFGVTRVILHPTSFDWQFVPDTPGGYTDAGSGTCH